MAAMIAAGIGAAGSIIGSKGGGGGGAQQAADPFAGQRGYYQNILRGAYGGMGGGIATQVAPAGAPTMDAYKAYNKYASAAGMSESGRIIPFAQWITGEGKQYASQPAGITSSAVSGGGGAGGGIADFIESSPDYQFRLAQGQKAVERSASARGMGASGNVLLDIMKHGQGMAAGAYESEINRIMTMAGATVGSPGVAGQIAAQQSALDSARQQQMLGGVGYGIGQMVQNWPGQTQTGMLQQQTGYSGGVEGILSGGEWESW